MSDKEQHIDPDQTRCTMPSVQEAAKCKRALNRMHVPAPDVEEAWKQFAQQRMTPSLTKRKHRKSLLIGFISGVAASILLFVAVTQLPPEPVPQQNEMQVFAAVPPQDKVILTMETGETYTFIPQTDSALHIPQVTQQALAANRPVLQEVPRWMTLTTPRGEDFRVTLPDGTAVWMNADSKLMFPETFSGGKREVKLQGEAYFEVARDESHPFEVSNELFTTSVLGTEFNVRAYSPEDAYVVLVSGKVALQTKRQSEPQIIQPGEKAQWREEGDFAVSRVDTYSYMQWKEGYFYFDNVPLVEVMQELGRWYNVDILFENAAAMHTRLHFVADRNQELDFALTNLNALKVVLAVRDGGKVIIR